MSKHARDEISPIFFTPPLDTVHARSVNERALQWSANRILVQGCPSLVDLELGLPYNDFNLVTIGAQNCIF